MRVLEEEPSAWFVLEQDGDLYLDVNCNNSAVSYSWLIRLNPDERTRLRDEGRAYLGWLAHDVHYTVPAGADSTSPYRDRNMPLPLQQAVAKAVGAWQGRSA